MASSWWSAGKLKSADRSYILARVRPQKSCSLDGATEGYARVVSRCAGTGNRPLVTLIGVLAMNVAVACTSSRQHPAIGAPASRSGPPSISATRTSYPTTSSMSSTVSSAYATTPSRPATASSETDTESSQPGPSSHLKTGASTLASEPPPATRRCPNAADPNCGPPLKQTGCRSSGPIGLQVDVFPDVSYVGTSVQIHVTARDPDRPLHPPAWDASGDCRQRVSYGDEVSSFPPCGAPGCTSPAAGPPPPPPPRQPGSVDSSATHSYRAPGRYTIIVRLFTGSGCPEDEPYSSSATQAVTITVR